VTDDRRSAPHVARNAAPIAEVLRAVLPERGLVLEVASGSGEHALHFARTFPNLLWQPSDPEPAALRSIEAWRADAGLFNLLPPVGLDARAAEWPVAQADSILCINMVHISPWAATAGLMRGAARLLEAGAPLYLYGAYRQAGVKTAPSNEAFDAGLRARNPEWGLRDLDEVIAEAEGRGFALERVTAMPANNLSVVFRRASLDEFRFELPWLNRGRFACSGLSLSRTRVTLPSPTSCFSSSRVPMSRLILWPLVPLWLGASSALSMMSLSSWRRAVSARSWPRSFWSVILPSPSPWKMTQGWQAFRRIARFARFGFRPGAGEPHEDHHQQQPEGPAAEHVAGPVDADHDPAEPDDDGEADGEYDGDGAVALPDRHQQRDRHIGDHRIGGMAAGE
jgi:hypothetical protein